jgi:hypothetical protein
MPFVLINPLQEVLSLKDYNKAIEKADTFSKKNEMPTEEKKPRGRPVGTIKKPKPEEVPEKKAVGRPKKVLSIITKPTIEAESKEETRQEESKEAEEPKKKKVGRPSIPPFSYEERHNLIFDTKHFSNDWFSNENEINKSLNIYFKNPKTHFIRFINDTYEIYDDDIWQIPTSGFGKKKHLNPERVVTDIIDSLISDHSLDSDNFNLDTDREQGKRNMTQLFMIIDKYLKTHFSV